MCLRRTERSTALRIFCMDAGTKNAAERVLSTAWKKGIKKKPIPFRTGFSSNRSELLLVDDQAIAIDKTFNGDTKEGVVVGVLSAGAFERGTGGTASTESGDCEDGAEDDESFFHSYTPVGLLCLKFPHGTSLLVLYIAVL